MNYLRYNCITKGVSASYGDDILFNNENNCRTIVRDIQKNPTRSCIKKYCSNVDFTIAPRLIPSDNDYRSLFYQCEYLRYAPIYDVSKAYNKSVRFMFAGCTNLVFIPKLDLSEIVDTLSLFQECSSLIKVPNFDLSNITNASSMFNLCRKLTNLEITAFKISDNAEINASSMFSRCNSITINPLNASFSDHVVNGDSMYLECTSLGAWFVHSFNNIRTASQMFSGSSIKYLYDNGNSFTKLTDASYMFKDSDFTGFLRGNLKGAVNLIDTSGMFWGCKNLKNGPALSTSNVTNMRNMFCNCTSLTKVPKYDVSKVTDMDDMFVGCTALTTLEGFENLKCDLSFIFSNELTHDSIMNVINLAADVTSSPKTLSLGPTNLAKLTDAEKKVATDKGWKLA